jgi:hypothetical protein
LAAIIGGVCISPLMPEEIEVGANDGLIVALYDCLVIREETKP